MGTQDYHGASELILSNHPDIIDATTISGRASVSHWDESDDGDEDKGLNSLYWRQTLDVSKLGSKKTPALSTLRKHCICHKEYNPDKTMFRCSSKCGTWNHIECLSDELRVDLEARSEHQMRKYLDKRSAACLAEMQKDSKSPGTSVGGRLSSMITVAKHVFDGTTIEHAVEEPVAAPKIPPSPFKGKKLTTPVAGRLRISVSNAGLGNNSEAVLANVDLLPVPEAETKAAKEWTIKLDCLKCGDPLD